MLGAIIHMTTGLGCGCRSEKTDEELAAEEEARAGLEAASPEYHPAVRAMLRTYDRRMTRGMGAMAAATPMTLGAAQALDAYLAQNGNAGCDDLKSRVRQLTFAFKAAFLSDPATQNSVEAAQLNMSTPLAMTGFGPGTNAALTYVLGGDRTYLGQNITDSDGNCLQAATPEIPGLLIAAGQTLSAQVLAMLKGATVATQGSVLQQVGDLVRAFLAQVAALIQGTPMPTPAPAPPAPKPVPSSDKPAEQKKPFPTGTVIAGGILGVLAIGGGVLLYQQHKRRKAA